VNFACFFKTVMCHFYGINRDIRHCVILYLMQCHIKNVSIIHSMLYCSTITVQLIISATNAHKNERKKWKLDSLRSWMLLLESRKSVWRSKRNTWCYFFPLYNFNLLSYEHWAWIQIRIQQKARIQIKIPNTAYTISRPKQPIAEMSKKIRELHQ
jgi:hypothetical protein